MHDQSQAMIENYQQNVFRSKYDCSLNLKYFAAEIDSFYDHEFKCSFVALANITNEICLIMMPKKYYTNISLAKLVKKSLGTDKPA